MTLKQRYEHSADQEGYLCQIQPNGTLDGGDTAHRTSHFHFLMSLKENKELQQQLLPYSSKVFYKKQMSELESKWGCYTRYPKKSYNLEPQHYYNGGPYSGVMSRDQSTGLLIAAGANNDYYRVFRMMVTHSLRLFLVTQKSRRFLSETEGHSVWRKPDLTLFEFFALYLRGLPLLGVLLYPILMLCDIETLFSSLFHRLGRSNGNDVQNHVSICLYGRTRLCTPIMWLANKLNSYKDMRAKQVAYWSGWRQQSFFVDINELPMRKYFSE